MLQNEGLVEGVKNVGVRVSDEEVVFGIEIVLEKKFVWADGNKVKEVGFNVEEFVIWLVVAVVAVDDFIFIVVDVVGSRENELEIFEIKVGDGTYMVVSIVRVVVNSQN